MDLETQRALIAHLESHLTPERRQRLDAVLAERTRYITLVLEDIFQFHNASATVRTCDCLGVQDLHVIENRNTFGQKIYKDQNVAMGANKWLTLHRYGPPPLEWKAGDNGLMPNTVACFDALRARGYRIVATTLREDAVDLAEVPTDRPIALLVGNEKLGLSETAHKGADLAVKLPLLGFTQSYNLSVCAALCLHDLVRRVRSTGNAWRMPEAEKTALKLHWLRDTTPGAAALEEAFLAGTVT